MVTDLQINIQIIRISLLIRIICTICTQICTSVPSSHMRKLVYLVIIVVFLASFVTPARAASLLERLSGRIVLQVEEHGEAWFISSIDHQRYYMGRPADAFGLMRGFGIGITNEDLTKIQLADANFNGQDSDSDGLPDIIEQGLGTDINLADSDGDGYNDAVEILNGHSPLSTWTGSIVDKTFSAKHAGKIFLQVGSVGEAWYINPLDNKRYYLGRPDDAFNIMKTLGIGITNNDLEKITAGEIAKPELESSADVQDSDNETSQSNNEDSADSDDSTALDDSSDDTDDDEVVVYIPPVSGGGGGGGGGSSAPVVDAVDDEVDDDLPVEDVVEDDVPDEVEDEPVIEDEDDGIDQGYYLQLAYDEADWVISCVQDSGAVGTTPSGTHVDPYYANLGLVGVLELEDSSYYPEVKKWLDWYFANYNEEADNLGVVGTIYDYIKVDGEYIPEYINDASKKNYDSSDAYAGTFLSLVWEYYQLTNDTDYITTHLDDLKNIAGAIDATFNETNLTSAKPDYSTEYLMDNTEVYRGYADFGELLSSIGDDQATFYTQRADAVALAIEDTMWAPEDDGYIYWRDHEGGIDWTEFYPDAKASFWPVIFHMPIPEDRAVTIYNRLKVEQPGWVTFSINDSPNASTSYIAVLAGDTDTAEQYIENTREKFPDRRWPWKISEGGWLIKTLLELAK
jgi:hypothetical protein